MALFRAFQMHHNTKKGCSSERDCGSPNSPRTHIGCFLHELEIHIVNVVRLLDHDQPFDYQHKYLRNSRSKNILCFFIYINIFLVLIL